MKIIALLACAFSVFGANHYIRDGGTGSGSCSDWSGSNACDVLPATLTRGDTYYIADGSYSTYTFDDANSGTTTITIKKATIADHGTATGWLDTYGDGQAIFSSWLIYTDYYVFNGVSRNSDWWLGTTNQYGISTGNTRIDNGSGSGGDNLSFLYIDFHGGGRDTGSGDDVIYGLAGNSNLTFQNCALRDSDRTIFLMRGNWQNLIVDHSYIARNTSTPANHGEMLSMTDSATVQWSFNVMEDIEGTAFIAGLNGGTATDWNIYGNVFFHSAAYIADTGRVAGHNFGVAGAIFCAFDVSQHNTCQNFNFYNNTIYTIQGSYSGVVIQNGTGNVVENNLWYGSVRTNMGGISTIDYNWYFSTTQDGDSSTHKTVCSSGCNIFVDSANKNFRLASNTVSAGLSLSSPFDVDPDGTTRGSSGAWSRGAYEYSTGGASTPTVTTTSATSITTTAASSGGTVTSDGGASVTSEGVCYGLTTNPTTPCTSDGTSTPFTSSISGLSLGTLYHYRAFATNSVGTSYGSDLTFTTLRNPSARFPGNGIRPSRSH